MCSKSESSQQHDDSALVSPPPGVSPSARGGSLLRIADLKPGDHLCCLYETEEEHRAVLTPYLRRGLERGEKVLYIVDAHTAAAVLGYLQDEGLGVGPYLESGQLSILAVRDAYLREGVFDPERMIGLLEAETERALAEGYAALRVTGEMTWALRELPGSERFIEYEAKLNEFFPGSKCLAICQYDRRRFEPAVLLDVLATHPICVVGTELYDNFYFIPAAEFLGEDRVGATLRRRLGNLAQRKRNQEALKESEARFRRWVDHATDESYLVDFDGTIVDVNQTACDRLGYTKDELLKLNLADIDIDVIPGKHAEKWKEVLTGAPITVSGVRRRKDGTTYPVEVRAGLIELGGRRLMLGLARDITERKRAEEALRESKERLKLAQSAADIGTWDWDIESNKATCSERYFELFGLERDTGVHPYEGWLASVHPEDRERAVQVVQRALEGTAPYSNEYRVVWPDGSVHWLTSKGKVFRDESGRPRRMIGANIDITERKRAEEALERERRLLEAVFENSQSQLVYLDRDFNFVKVNEAYARACARPKEEFIGRNHFELYPSEAEEIFRRVRDTGEPYVAVSRPFTFPDHPEWGETYWDWTLAPVKDAAGRVEGLVFSLVDVTERVRRLQEIEGARGRIEELARAEQERANWLAAVLDQVPTGVYIARAPDVKIVLQNKAAREICGVPLQHAELEKHLRIFTPEGQPIRREEWPLARAVLRGEYVDKEHLVVERPDGSRVNLVANAAPLVEDGEAVGGVVAFWDITAEKQAQRQLEEAGRLKDEFLSMASHELKTPVTSIKIFSELAARHPKALPPKLVGTLLRQADQLVGLVNDLLDVSRLQLGRMPLEVKRLDLAALVSELCERRRPLFEGRLVSCPNPQETLLVEGDSLRLEQVFSNLLDNAVKYSPGGSPIRLRLSRRNNTAVVEVEDEGVGISGEHLPHIFERFYKPGHQQSVYSGLGVGLHISKEIVERHRGRIWAESQEGKGSKFYVELPLAS